MTKTTIDGLPSAINDILEEYTKEVKEVVGECGQKVSKDAVGLLKTKSPKRNARGGGKYAKSWDFKEEKGILGTPMYIIYNKKHYRLTHLLEYGHVIRNGTRRTFGSVKGKPHIKSVEEWVQQEFPATIERKLGGN